MNAFPSTPSALIIIIICISHNCFCVFLLVFMYVIFSNNNIND